MAGLASEGNGVDKSKKRVPHGVQMETEWYKCFRIRREW
jgi:hypothetical protein